MDEFFGEPFLRDISTSVVDHTDQEGLRRLKLVSQEVYRKRVLLQNDYGIVLNAQMTLVARLSFLTAKLFGINCPERLILETEWLKKHILSSLEQAHWQCVQDAKAKKLHLPQGGVKLIKPLENGQDSEA